jgi:hypothetical protein
MLKSLMVFMLVFGLIMTSAEITKSKIKVIPDESVQVVVVMPDMFGRPNFYIITIEKGMFSDSSKFNLFWWYESKPPVFVNPDKTINIEKWSVEYEKRYPDSEKEEDGAADKAEQK